MFEQVKSILSKQLRVKEDAIKPESTFQELGADSLDMVQLMMTLEEDYNLVIPEEELAKIATVADVVKYLENN